MSCVTEKNVEDSIASLQFVKLGKKTTVGIATLTNGFEIVESSSCVHEDKYSESIGKNIVEERLHHKIWELLGSKAQDVNAAANPEQQPLPLTDDEGAFDQPEPPVAA